MIGPLVVVFGESPNDSESVKELLGALRPDWKRVQVRRRPLVLQRGAKAGAQRGLVEQIAGVVRAERLREPVARVFVHQDCDACEPAHQVTAARLEAALRAAGVEAIAVTPAWEIEAWWFLWPEAAVAVCPSWQLPKPPRNQVGKIRDAKQVLIRALRPKRGGHRIPDYAEADSPRIARKVRELGLIDRQQAVSESFEAFAARARE